MSEGGPLYPRLPVQNTRDRHGKRFVGAVAAQIVPVLLPLLLGPHALREGRPQLVQLFPRERGQKRRPRGPVALLRPGIKRGAPGGGGGVEAEGLREQRRHALERPRRPLAEALELLVERLRRLPLRRERREEVRRRALRVDAHAARLVVGEDDDQRIVRAGAGEGERLLHRRVKGQHVADGRRCVVAVAGPVDPSPLDHHEEAVRVVEQLDTPLRELRKGGAPRRAVRLVRQRPADRRGRDDPGPRPGRGKLRAGAEHAVPLLAGEVVHVLQVALPPRAPVDAAPREVVEAALDHLDADLVKVGPGGTRGVEGRRSGVVQKDRRDHADLHPPVAGDFRDGGQFFCPRRVHAEDAVVRLESGGQRRPGGGGVRHGGVRRPRGDRPAHGKSAQRERPVSGRDAVQLCGLDLRPPHAVADEEKDVLRPLRASEGRGGEEEQEEQNRADGA